MFFIQQGQDRLSRAVENNLKLNNEIASMIKVLFKNAYGDKKGEKKSQSTHAEKRTVEKKEEKKTIEAEKKLIDKGKGKMVEEEVTKGNKAEAKEEVAKSNETERYNFAIPQIAKSSFQGEPQEFRGVPTTIIFQQNANSKLYHDIAFLTFLQSMRESSQFDYFNYTKKLKQHILVVTVVRRQVSQESPHEVIQTDQREA